MKLKNNFATSANALLLGFAFLFTISLVEGKTLTQIIECQELLKIHRNYSEPRLTPISAQFAEPTFYGILDEEQAENELESFVDIERMEEIKVRITMQEFYYEIKNWRLDILSCTDALARDCAKESMKIQIESQNFQIASLLTYYDMLTHSFAKINTTEMYENIAEHKKIFAEIETTQIDLCASGDSECQDCLENNADRYYTEGLTCHNFRHWHIIKYRPIRNNPCLGMKHTRIEKKKDGGYQLSYY